MIAAGGLLEKARDGVMTLDLPACIKDSQLRYVCVNDAYARFAGRSRQDFTGKTSRQLHGMADDGDRDDKERRCLVFATDETLKCAGFSPGEAPAIKCERFETEDGSLFLFEVFEAMPAARPSNEKTSTFPKQNGLTHPLAQASAAEHPQPDAQSILDSLPVGIMIVGPDLTMEYANGCFHTLWDISEKIDLAGQHYRACLEMAIESSDFGNLRIEEGVEHLTLIDGTASRQIESKSGRSILLFEQRIGGDKILITAFDCTDIIERERESNAAPKEQEPVGENTQTETQVMLEEPALAHDVTLSVLVIEDAAAQGALSEQLTGWGADAYAAESTATAIAILKEAAIIGFAIDAIILNHTVPVQDGMELARTMRQDPRLSDTAIISLTAMDITSADHDALDVQFIKSVGAELLKKTLTELVHKNRARRSAAQDTSKSTVAETQPPLNLTRATPNVSHVPTLAPNRTTSSLDVLIAEDNDVNQIVFNQILQQTGLRYRIVDNGEQAVQIWRAFRPSIILMDISMPVMNGYRATQAIRAEEDRMLNASRVPIIGVMAHAQESDRDLCLAAGMDDYLSKPISPELLNAKIQTWLMKSLATLAN
ncbi:response regulator [Rhizobium skierniewicense]|uniref:response regulator n=1 Tax=Rhizobium skierniewicense TaxID=984260 RepID=UPI001FAC63C4|nr:response regulator [Rhizobium skierniewicense]MCI9864710.1 response regulator [Rhizobium skierniewicense]